MVRPTEENTSAIEKVVCYTQIPRRGDMPGQWADVRKQPRVCYKAPEGRRKRGQEPLLLFWWEEVGEAGQQA